MADVWRTQEFVEQMIAKYHVGVNDIIDKLTEKCINGGKSLEAAYLEIDRELDASRKVG